MQGTEFFTVRGIPAGIKTEFKLACMRRHVTAGQAIAEMMAEYIALTGHKTKLWKGYERVAWANVKLGETVYLSGVNHNGPVAYGPNTVVRPGLLKNEHGAEFFHHPETLLRKEK